MTIEFKEIFISDLHLLSSKTNISALETLFLQCNIEKIHCIGDFVDCWRLFAKEMRDLKRQDADRQLRIFRKILKRLETYVFGNHDDILFKLAHFGEYPLGSIIICHDRIVNINDHPTMLIHGHQWDFIVANSRILARFGDRIYHAALYLNSIYNWISRHKKSKKFRLSGMVKRLGKTYLKPFVINSVEYARKNNCEIIICGHIHTPGYKYDYVSNCLYINTGCFTGDESTFLGLTPENKLFLFRVDGDNIKKITDDLLEIFRK